MTALGTTGIIISSMISLGIIITVWRHCTKARAERIPVWYLIAAMFFSVFWLIYGIKQQDTSLIISFALLCGVLDIAIIVSVKYQDDKKATERKKEALVESYKTKDV